MGSYYDNVKGGVSGVGLEKNICDCYFIVDNYAPGDRLYFFGFSRGATVRSWQGSSATAVSSNKSTVISSNMLLKTFIKVATLNRVANALTISSGLAIADRSPIDFIGVFDTVGALGVPITFFGLLNNDEHLFHDLEPSSIVNVARHRIP